MDHRPQRSLVRQGLALITPGAAAGLGDIAQTAEQPRHAIFPTPDNASGERQVSGSTPDVPTTRGALVNSPRGSSARSGALTMDHGDQGLSAVVPDRLAIDPGMDAISQSPFSRAGIGGGSSPLPGATRQEISAAKVGSRHAVDAATIVKSGRNWRGEAGQPRGARSPSVAWHARGDQRGLSHLSGLS